MGARAGRARPTTIAVVAALIVVACAGAPAATPAPASLAATGAATPATSATPDPSSAPVAVAAPTPAAPLASATVAPPAPQASRTLAPLPTPGTARAFSCPSLATGAQVTSFTGVQVVLMDLSMLPSMPGVTLPKLPKLPKGETECKYLGGSQKGSRQVILTVDVTILTDGARANFDQTWQKFRGTPLVATVPGVGDDAAWFAPQDTLVGIQGPIAFVITLEPMPIDYYKPAAARAVAVAVARQVVAHL